MCVYTYLYIYIKKEIKTHKPKFVVVVKEDIYKKMGYYETILAETVKSKGENSSMYCKAPLWWYVMSRWGNDCPVIDID